jgi:putative Mg2+ transporter-C (MgtC) family protein
VWKLSDIPTENLLQIAELSLAFLLCALIGIEREVRQKSAGLRTHTLVGVSAALFMLISKYGFMDIISYGRIVLDPSRVAAQVVSGIGFIGGGVIFMRRDVVRGLTTAASIWFTAALGMACGAGLIVLAIATTVGYFLIMLAFPALSRRLPKAQKLAAEIYISYEDGKGLLRTILIRCTELRFAIDRVRLDEHRSVINADEQTLDRADREGVAYSASPSRSVTLMILVKGKRPVSHLIATLSNIKGVHEVGNVTNTAELE